uniref:KIF-binding protein n=1 Tax=Macrostomum lignano TaxID=282301 RepID=A0A1I8JQ23_9PLAT
MVTDCQWIDNLVALQLWVKLAFIALEMQENNLALHLDGHLDDGQQQQPQIQQHRQTVRAREHLSLAASLKRPGPHAADAGQDGRPPAGHVGLPAGLPTRQAGEELQLIAAAARLYWNAAASLVGQPIERQLLLEPLQTMLEAMSATVDRKTAEETVRETRGAAAAAAPEEDDSPPRPEERRLEQKIQFVQSAPEQTRAGLFPPLANMYGVLFQAYADKGDLDKGSKAMDDAIAALPRPNTGCSSSSTEFSPGAKLGNQLLWTSRSFGYSLFTNEPEDKQAELWRIVALKSRMKSQLEAYKNAIECITLPEHDWLKVDLLVEFSQWLYTNGFPLELCTAQVDWAIDILLGMAFEEPVKEDTARGKARQKGPPSAASTVASQQSKKAAAAKSAATAAPLKTRANPSAKQSPASPPCSTRASWTICCAVSAAGPPDHACQPAHRHALHAAHACVLRLFQPPGRRPKTKVEEKRRSGGGKGGKGGKGGGKEKEELTSMIALLVPIAQPSR